MTVNQNCIFTIAY